jgi:hypothetical protein
MPPTLVRLPAPRSTDHLSRPDPTAARPHPAGTVPSVQMLAVVIR